jgi:hypothetical protein
MNHYVIEVENSVEPDLLVSRYLDHATAAIVNAVAYLGRHGRSGGLPLTNLRTNGDGDGDGVKIPEAAGCIFRPNVDTASG